MNDPKNNQNLPPDDLGRAIEKEVRKTIDAVASSVQTAAREVRSSLQDNEELKRAARDFGAAARQGVKELQSAFGEFQRQNGKQKAKRMKKRVDYRKKANGALSESGGLLLPAGVLAAVSTMIASEGEWAFLITGFISLWFVGGSIVSFFQYLKYKRMAGYQSVLSTRSYCTLRELAEYSGKSQGAVRRDLTDLISGGKFEDVYLAPDGSRLFSNETAYRLYMAHLSEMEHTFEPIKEEEAPEEEAPQGGVPAVCRAFLSDLRAEKARIREETVLAQVTQIEVKTQQIVTWLETHPGSESGVRRFAGYYLPTTLKLLRTYNEMGAQGIGSAVAAEIQADICGTLGKIDTAFAALRDGLLKDTAMDVSSEISALETVLAQEGLTKDGLLG